MCIKLAQLSLIQKNLTSSEHHILFLLAFRADNDSKCWPSILSIQKNTSLDRKTILKSIQSLIDKKLIILTDERKGRTKKINVYKLNLNDPNIGYALKTSDPNFSISDPKNGMTKRSQIWDTERSYMKDHRKNVSTQKSKNEIEADNRHFIKYGALHLVKEI